MSDIDFKERQKRGRGVESVAHFFLSDVKCSELPQKDTPDHSSKDAAPQKADNDSDLTVQPSNLFIMISSDDHLAQGAFLCCLLALFLARDNINVGLLETTIKLPHTFFLSGGYRNLNALFWEASIDAPEFSSIVTRFQKTCDIVFLHVDASSFARLPGLPIPIGRCLIPTTVRSKDLLSAYGVIKNGVQKKIKKEFDLILFQDKPTDKIKGAVKVMEKMVQQFLSCSICFLGAIQMAKDEILSPSILSTEFYHGVHKEVTASIAGIAQELMNRDE